MITFFPGPSRVYPQVAQWLQEAYQEGILSISHRSQRFNELSEKTITLLKQKLNIPADYCVLYTSSATENWEIISQSFAQKQTLHYYNGSFGERWYEYAKHILPATLGFSFGIQETIAVERIKQDITTDTEIICITQNETSNGTQWKLDKLQALRQAFPQQLIAVDTTSSMAGLALPFETADIWYASVQKCFGLPAGLGLLVLSPKAVAHGLQKDDGGRYNSFKKMYSNIKKWQTNYTPSVLHIYLLYKVLETMPTIQEVHQTVLSRAIAYKNAVQNATSIQLLIQNEEAISDTVIAVAATPSVIEKCKKEAKEVGILLGNGYGEWKENTFRIANFPALQDDEVALMLNLLKKW